jgi:hypothetical protein
MNNFTMETFNSGEAFDEPALELARILRELADRVEAALTINTGALPCTT